MLYLYATRNAGFTFIEILVTIAIIGILSTVILAAIDNTRSKSADANVKANLRSVQTQAELYFYKSSNSYGTQAQSIVVATCTAGGGLFSDNNIRSALTQATTQGKGGVECFANNTSYAAAAQLKTSTNYWCVDSKGSAISIAAASLPTFSAGQLCQ